MEVDKVGDEQKNKAMFSNVQLLGGELVEHEDEASLVLSHRLPVTSPRSGHDGQQGV